MHATTIQETATDPRVRHLAQRLFPHAPGATPWHATTFYAHMRDTVPNMPPGEQEMARLIASLAWHEELLEDIGQFDFRGALTHTTGAQRDIFLEYLKEAWMP